MTTRHIEVFVEEPSMEAALQLILPKLLHQITFSIYPFTCKTDLLSKLPQRLRGYRKWLPSDYRILIVIDRDSDDCPDLVSNVLSMVKKAGLKPRPKKGTPGYQVACRLAIEELEAWYFGDWEAVTTAYPKISRDVTNKAPFRNPDAIKGGTWEAFERVAQRAGYFDGGLRKIEAARTIARHMDAQRNTSQSFQAFSRLICEISRL